MFSHKIVSRQYLFCPNVLTSLFHVAHKLYLVSALKITERNNIFTRHWKKYVIILQRKCLQLTTWEWKWGTRRENIWPFNFHQFRMTNVAKKLQTIGKPYVSFFESLIYYTFSAIKISIMSLFHNLFYENKSYNLIML